MKNGIYFYKKEFKVPKKGAPHKFGFPAVVATLKYSTMKRLKMEAAIKRFATALMRQLEKENDQVIGIEINGIRFTIMYRIMEGV